MKTILIVEDSSDGRRVYRDALEASRYRVLQAEDGAAGIRTATEQPPDLVLMNISMPLINGVDAVEILKGHPATENVPVVVVSGHTSPGVRDSAWEAGCDEYLHKPLSPSEMLKVVADRIGVAR